MKLGRVDLGCTGGAIASAFDVMTYCFGIVVVVVVMMLTSITCP
jgi:hypothetical protein